MTRFLTNADLDAIGAVRWRKIEAEIAVEIASAWNAGKDAIPIAADLALTVGQVTVVLGFLSNAGVRLRAPAHIPFNLRSAAHADRYRPAPAVAGPASGPAAWRGHGQTKRAAGAGTPTALGIQQTRLCEAGGGPCAEHSSGSPRCQPDFCRGCACNRNPPIG